MFHIITNIKPAFQLDLGQKTCKTLKALKLQLPLSRHMLPSKNNPQRKNTTAPETN